MSILTTSTLPELAPACNGRTPLRTELIGWPCISAYLTRPNTGGVREEVEGQRSAQILRLMQVCRAFSVRLRTIQHSSGMKCGSLDLCPNLLHPPWQRDVERTPLDPPFPASLTSRSAVGKYTPTAVSRSTCTVCVEGAYPDDRIGEQPVAGHVPIDSPARRTVFPRLSLLHEAQRTAQQERPSRQVLLRANSPEPCGERRESSPTFPFAAAECRLRSL